MYSLLLLIPCVAIIEVRRSSATTKSYSSVVTLHQRYRRLSILKKPREFVPNIAVYPRPPAIQQDAHTKPSLSLAMPDNVDGSSGVAQPPSQSQGPFKRRRCCMHYQYEHLVLISCLHFCSTKSLRLYCMYVCFLQRSHRGAPQGCLQEQHAVGGARF